MKSGSTKLSDVPPFKVMDTVTDLLLPPAYLKCQRQSMLFQHVLCCGVVLSLTLRLLLPVLVHASLHSTSACIPHWSTNRCFWVITTRIALLFLSLVLATERFLQFFVTSPKSLHLLHCDPCWPTDDVVATTETYLRVPLFPSRTCMFTNIWRTLKEFNPSHTLRS